MVNLMKNVNNPRQWISAVIQRARLPQSVLHSLGVCVELAHLRGDALQSLDPDMAK